MGVFTTNPPHIAPSQYKVLRMIGLEVVELTFYRKVPGAVSNEPTATAYSGPGINCVAPGCSVDSFFMNVGGNFRAYFPLLFKYERAFLIVTCVRIQESSP